MAKFSKGFLVQIDFSTKTIGTSLPPVICYKVTGIQPTPNGQRIAMRWFEPTIRKAPAYPDNILLEIGPRGKYISQTGFYKNNTVQRPIFFRVKR